jgi:hypothetical protein
MQMLSLLLLACGGPFPPSSALQEAVRYRLQMHGDFQTQAHGADSVVAWQGGETADVSWVFELSPFEMHRDESVELRLRVLEASLAVDGQERPTSLAGRYIHVRAFEHAELLKVEHYSHFSGHERYGDAFELLLPALFPNPPSVDRRGTKISVIRWPLGSIGRSKVVAEWELLELNSREAKLGYEGNWTSEGGWQGLDLKGIGEVSGTLWIPTGGGLPSRHELQWGRHLEYIGAGAIRQRQDFSGHLERL